MTGEVKPRQNISSTTIRLTGDASQEIKHIVTISPSKENPFHITTISAGKGDNIRYDLTEIKQRDGKEYHLSVYNTKKDKGWYLDKIYIKTNSKITPEFTISVFGIIRDNE